MGEVTVYIAGFEEQIRECKDLLFRHFTTHSSPSLSLSLSGSLDICSVLEVSYQTVSTELVREYLGGIDGERKISC